MKASFLSACVLWALGLNADGFLIRDLTHIGHVARIYSPRKHNGVNCLTQKPSSDLGPSYNPRIRFQTLLSSVNDNNDGSGLEEANLSHRATGFLVLLTVPLAWGTYVPVVRYLYEIQPPVPGFVFSACYYFVAATTLLSITWAKRGVTRDEIKAKINSTKTLDSDAAESQVPTSPFPLVGGLELGTYLFLGNGLQVLGLKTVSSDRAGFLVQLTTVMVPLVQGALASNLLTIPVRTWLACAIAFSGVLVMGADGIEATDDFVLQDMFASFSSGDFLIVSSAFVYTMHVVRLEKYAKLSTPVQLGASKATFEAIFSTGLVVALMSVAGATTSAVAVESNGLLSFASESGREISNFFESITSSLRTGSLPLSALLPALGAVLWTGWVTCAYTITAQTYGQSRVTATEANLIYSVQPLFTAAFAYFLLGETLSPLGAVGGGLIAGAVYMVASAPTPDGDNDNDEPTEDVSTDTLKTGSVHALNSSVASDDRVLEQIER